MPQLARQTAKEILDTSADRIGKTDWYFNLHFYRFLCILDIALRRKNHTETEKVLELGVWPGFLAAALQEAGFEVSGVDINPDRLKQTGLDLEIVRCNLNAIPHTLPYPSDFFDRIIVSEVIEHIEPENLPGLLAEIDRLLNTHGSAIITTPNRHSLHNLLSPSKNTAIGKKDGHGHIREYSLAELRKIIRQSPLSAVETKAINFYSNIGTLSDGKYFYPLKDFWNHPNKLFNFFKLVSSPVKYIPFLRDSLIIQVKKNDQFLEKN